MFLVPALAAAATLNAAPAGLPSVRGLALPLRGWAFPYQFNGSFELYPLGTTNFNPTLDTSCQGAEAQARRGIAPLNWAYCWNRPLKKADPSCKGNNCTVANPKEAIEIFAAQGSVNHSAPGMSAAVLGRGLDECNLDNEQVADERELAAAGFRLARRRQPDTIIAGWGANAGDMVFAGLMADHTFDFAMIEGYTYCAGAGTRAGPSPIRPIRSGLPAPNLAAGCGDWPASGDCCPVGPIEDAVEKYADRLDFARAQGYLNRTLFCFGFILGQSPINPFGWTPASLRAAMLKVKHGYPELAGVIMYGMPPRVGYPNASTASTPATDAATTELIKAAGELMLEFWPSSSPAASHAPDHVTDAPPRNEEQATTSSELGFSPASPDDFERLVDPRHNVEGRLPPCPSHCNMCTDTCECSCCGSCLGPPHTHNSSTVHTHTPTTFMSRARERQGSPGHVKLRALGWCASFQFMFIRCNQVLAFCTTRTAVVTRRLHGGYGANKYILRG